MKKLTIVLLFIFTSFLTAQERARSNYAVGVNYLKTQLVGADIKLYNVHFEKQSPGSITFGVDALFQSGIGKKEFLGGYEKVEALYGIGPTIIYTDAVVGMLFYKVSANANLGHIDYQKVEGDIIFEEDGLHYGFIGRLEAIAQISTRMQFNIGLGFQKGFTASGDVELDSNSTYHIGITYLF